MVNAARNQGEMKPLNQPQMATPAQTRPAKKLRATAMFRMAPILSAESAIKRTGQGRLLPTGWRYAPSADCYAKRFLVTMQLNQRKERMKNRDRQP